MVSVAVGLLPLRIELFRSIEFYPARALLSLHNMHLCRHSLNFAHVPVVDAGHLSIVPGNRDRIPTRFCDNAAISGIAPPTNAGALLEFFNSLTVIVAPPVPSFPAVMRILREAANRVFPSCLALLHFGVRTAQNSPGLSAIERCWWLLMSRYGAMGGELAGGNAD